ncbi:kinase-like domain-containing protein [Mycena crocata]|nr:kinase-like domain-containing protein [Mycena crocata]
MSLQSRGDGQPTATEKPLDTAATKSVVYNRSSGLPTSGILYHSLMSFIREAAQNMSPKLQPILNDCFNSMAAKDIVDGLVQSAKHRKLLSEIASKLKLTRDPGFRDALHADEKRIATQLGLILNSEAGRRAILTLRGEEAKHFLDVIQTTLDRGYLMAQEHSSEARAMIRKLSVLTDNLPPTLFVNVTEREEHPLLGGACSDIYRGRFQNTKVALKVMRTFHRGSDLHRFRSNFYREALIWKSLEHPNILPFIGVDRESFSPSTAMVSPWMVNGTILQYLKSHERIQANVNKLLVEIAEGLQYLHSCNIVHGDLRGANILIDDEPKACIADFGVSFLSDIPSEHTQERAGGLRWMAPELIDPESFGTQFAPTTASDVYAFGCLCLEVYTGQPPFAKLSDVRTLFMVMGGNVPERPLDTDPFLPEQLWQLMKDCWVKDRSSRPSMGHVVQNLSTMETQSNDTFLDNIPQQELLFPPRWSTPPPEYSTTPAVQQIPNIGYSVPIPGPSTMQESDMTDTQFCDECRSTFNSGASLEAFQSGSSQMILNSGSNLHDTENATDDTPSDFAAATVRPDLVDNVAEIPGLHDSHEKQETPEMSMFRNSSSGEVSQTSRVENNREVVPGRQSSVEPNELAVQGNIPSGYPGQSTAPHKLVPPHSGLLDPGGPFSIGTSRNVVQRTLFQADRLGNIQSDLVARETHSGRGHPEMQMGE